VLRAVARHRGAKANGDEAGARAALAEARRELEAHLERVRAASR